MYYGQWETDRVIESYFPDKTDGVYVEVGAYDGIKGSNSKYFEDLGWDGMCIEPNPFIFAELKKNRTGDCELVACCKPGAEGTAELEIFNFESGIQSSLTSLHTDERLRRDYKNAIKDTLKVSVITETLREILWGKFLYFGGLPDFMSIDTEGTELDVLKGWFLSALQSDDSVYVPLLVVENNYDDPEIGQYLKEFGYRRDQRYYVNDFYVRD